MTERMGGMDSIRDLLDGAGRTEPGEGPFGAMRWQPNDAEEVQ